MLADGVRTEAYARALAAAVRPGSSVIEIGTGVGYFAVVACRVGAARVDAIEANPAIRLAVEVARINGCEDRIRFHQDMSTNLSVEPADILVSDMRGVLPFHTLHIPSIIDARARLLKPSGVQIPACDTLWLALVDGKERRPLPGGPAGDDGPIDLGPVERVASNAWRKEQVFPADLITAPGLGQTIDYRTVAGPDFEGTTALVAERDGRADGFSMWFDTELYKGIGFSNAPGCPRTLYGQAFFPFAQPLSLSRGDKVRVTVRAKLISSAYQWSWEGRVESGRNVGASFNQSTFLGTALDPRSLRKRADRFVPRLGRRGQAHALILARMGEALPLRSIAEEAVAAFPDVFRDFQGALTEVANVSEDLSE